jgi:isopentenyl phosphate kinase
MTTFLKLGGSVLTEKSGRKSARLDTIQRIATEIAESINRNPSQKLLLGHGSGSFGHSIAAEHATHLGAYSEKDWKGFAEVWRAARELNSILISELASVGLPVVSFPPSASALSDDGQLVSMAVDTINHALEADLLPVVYGDVIFDRRIGASIASTEQVFAFLAETLNPDRLLVAGREDGVYDLQGQEPILLSEITPKTRSKLQFTSPEGMDVTGGMGSKVDLCLAMARRYPDLEILIFSAEHPGHLRDVLSGSQAGTRIGT